MFAICRIDILNDYKIPGKFGRNIDVPIHIDPDSVLNSPIQYFLPPKGEDEKVRLKTRIMSKTHVNKGDLIFNYLSTAFNDCCGRPDYWTRALEAHQPLRQMFWDAFSSEKVGDC